MVWARTLCVRDTHRIHASGIRMQIHLQERIAGAEGPPMRYFPIYGGLYTLRGPAHFVAQHDGVNEKWWNRVRIEKRGSRLQTLQPLIGIEKRRDIERKVVRGLLSITQFICYDVFRLHIWVAEQGDFSRPGQWFKSGIQTHVSPRGSAVGT